MRLYLVCQVVAVGIEQDDNVPKALLILDAEISSHVFALCCVHSVDGCLFALVWKQNFHETSVAPLTDCSRYLDYM